MSKIMNPLDLLRRSKTGAAIVAEIEKDDETAEARKSQARSVADADAKLADAQRELKVAEQAERMKIKIAKVAFEDAIAAARRATAEARQIVARLERQRNAAAKLLGQTADPRIEAFRLEIWQEFQSKRGGIRQLVEELPTNRVNTVTNKRVTHLHHNGNAIARWAETIRRVMTKCESLKLEPLTEGEIGERIAALRAEVDGAEARSNELTDAGPSPGDALSEAITSAPVISRGQKGARYQVIDEPELVG